MKYINIFAPFLSTEKLKSTKTKFWISFWFFHIFFFWNFSDFFQKFSALFLKIFRFFPDIFGISSWFVPEFIGFFLVFFSLAPSFFLDCFFLLHILFGFLPEIFWICSWLVLLLPDFLGFLPDFFARFFPKTFFLIGHLGWHLDIDSVSFVTINAPLLRIYQLLFPLFCPVVPRPVLRIFNIPCSTPSILLHKCYPPLPEAELGKKEFLPQFGKYMSAMPPAHSPSHQRNQIRTAADMRGPRAALEYFLQHSAPLPWVRKTGCPKLNFFLSTFLIGTQLSGHAYYKISYSTLV